MANTSIPNLPPVIALSGAEQLEVIQAGTSSRATLNQVAELYPAYEAGAGLTLSNTTFSISNTTVSAGTYANASVTVNPQGQVTAIASGAPDMYLIVTAPASYTETSAYGDKVVIVTGSAVTVTLPTAISNNAKLTFKLSVPGTMTLVPFGSQLIDGGSTAFTSIQYTSITIVSDNANWWVI